MIINADCFDELPKLDDNSIDLIFCDLPFGILKTNWECDIDLDKLWIELKRVSKPTTPIFFCCNTKMGYKIMKSALVEFKYDLCWIKNTTSGHLLSGKRPLSQHELVYVFYDKQPYYNLSSHTREGKKSIKEYSFESAYGEKTIRQSKGKWSPPLPTSILEYTSSRKFHQTEKPVELIEWIVKYYSKEGDKVLDPTCGSGSSAIACKKLLREYIGYEKDKKIYDIALERYDRET